MVSPCPHWFRQVAVQTGPGTGMMAGIRLWASVCCNAVNRLAGVPNGRDGKPLGPESVAHFRDGCRVRSPHTSGRSAAFEPAGGLRAHQGARGGIRRDPLRTLVVRDGADAVRPPPSRGVGADHRRRRTSQALRAGAARRTDRQAPKLGTVLEPSVLRVGDLMVLARDRYPQIELELVQVMSSDGLARVRGGTLDASFYFGAEPEADLAAIELRDIVYHVTMPVGLGCRARRTRRGRPSPGAPGSSHRSRARTGGS